MTAFRAHAARRSTHQTVRAAAVHHAVTAPCHLPSEFLNGFDIYGINIGTACPVKTNVHKNTSLREYYYYMGKKGKMQ